MGAGVIDFQTPDSEDGSSANVKEAFNNGKASTLAMYSQAPIAIDRTGTSRSAVRWKEAGMPCIEGILRRMAASIPLRSRAIQPRTLGTCAGRLLRSSWKQCFERTRGDAEALQNPVLPIETIRRSDNGDQLAHSDSAPRGHMKHGQRIIRAEQQPIGQLRMVAEFQQHQESIRQGERGQVCEEVRIRVNQREQGCIIRFMHDESIAAPVGGDDRDALVQRHWNPGRASDRLIFSIKAELVA